MNKQKIPTSLLYKQKHPCRDQMEMSIMCLDQLIPADHKAREIWDFVKKMDTDPCFRRIKSMLYSVGRPTTSPEVLFALWLYSIIDGNISARKLAELSEHHDAYKWIAGGVPVNRTTLAEFRSADPNMFNELLTNSLAVLANEGLIKEENMSQDGTRIKASAGNNTYRREKTLLEWQEQASNHIKSLQDELKKDPKSYENKKKLNEIVSLSKKKKKIDDAIEKLRKFREEKIRNNKKNHMKAPTKKELEDIRVSTTDPEARRMKMGDNGYRIAYNIQFATGNKSRLIYGVDAVNTLDPGTLLPMMLQVHQRIDLLNLSAPSHWFADSAYSGKDDIEVSDLTFPNCIFYAPPKVNKKVDPATVRKYDTESVKKWRRRIECEEIKEKYKERPSSAEFSNAQVKNKGFREILVRGLKKVKGVAYLHAIANNIERYWDLKKKDELSPELAI